MKTKFFEFDVFNYLKRSLSYAVSCCHGYWLQRNRRCLESSERERWWDKRRVIFNVNNGLVDKIIKSKNWWTCLDFISVSLCSNKYQDSLFLTWNEVGSKMLRLIGSCVFHETRPVRGFGGFYRQSFQNSHGRLCLSNVNYLDLFVYKNRLFASVLDVYSKLSH